jgi:catechol 2,3-dioxygenase-like lactoylglutathione lyase family enzyme
MSRVQLALNVADLDQAIAFYAQLFGVAPNKVKPGYANFAIEEPPLKLVLIEGGGEPGSINHLGVEVASTTEVASAITRLGAQGLATEVEEQTTCCFAVQDKVWVTAPDAERWEVYTVLEDAESFGPGSGDGACCATSPVAVAAPSSTGCC